MVNTRLLVMLALVAGCGGGQTAVEDPFGSDSGANRVDRGSANGTDTGGGGGGDLDAGGGGGGSGPTMYDGGVRLPDGRVVEGGELLPDGAVRLPDGAVIPGGGGSGGGDAGAPLDAGRRDASPQPEMLGTVILGEICDNGLDDNQDGRVDEGCPCSTGATQRCYPGRPAEAGGTRCTWGTMACDASSGVWGACTGFGRPQMEVCNGIDDNCDGRIDEECECPTEGASRPCYGAEESTRNVSVCRAGAQRCERDMVGRLTWGLCEGMVVPDFESCNGIDDDCDGQVDEGCACTLGAERPCYGGSKGTSGRGVCRAGTQRCQPRLAGGSAWGACEGEVLPQAETCNGADDNCDGVLDEGCGCTPGAMQPCGDDRQSAVGVGVCTSGVSVCTSEGRWGSCTGAVGPREETCNQVDDNCDGQVDEGCLCATGETPVYRIRLPDMPATQCGLQPADGGPNVVMRCEASRCPQGRVAIETAPGQFQCVAPPPSCALPNYLSWYPVSGWVCGAGCEVLVRTGGGFGDRTFCAERPRREICPTACFLSFDATMRTWVCAERCAGASAGIRFLGMQLCLPCPNPSGDRIRVTSD